MTTLSLSLIFPTSPSWTVLENPLIGVAELDMDINPRPSLGKLIKIAAVMSKLTATIEPVRINRELGVVSFSPTDLNISGGA